MSRTILPVLAVLSAVACSSAPPPSMGVASPQKPSAAQQSSRRERQLATLDTMKRALEARDPRALAWLYTDDAVVVPFGGRTRHGRAETEQGEAYELAPAASVRATDARVWLKDDVAIAEWKFRAALASPSKGSAVGTTELAVMWFTPDGRIREEHDYMNQGVLEMQAAGDPDAPALPEVPATTEVHDGPADEARALGWTARYEDACSHDDAAALSMMDEHMTWRCTLGFVADSRAPMPAVLEHWRAAFPDMHWQADHVWPIEDFVVVEETMTGTHRGPIGAFEASNRPVTWHWAEVWQVKDGKIAHGWSYANFRELRPQVTTAPQPAASTEVPCSFAP